MDSLQSTMAEALSSSSSSLPPLPSINQPLTVKLDDSNFLIWKNQLLNVVIANGLEDVLNGSLPCPPKINEFHPNLANPEYLTWQRYNRLIMSWIYASVHEQMLGQLIGYSSASEIWEALEKLYSASSFARISELRTNLQCFKKDGLSAIAYIQKFRNLCNTLAAIGEPVNQKDQLLYFLNGLGAEYNPFVTSVTTQGDQSSIEEINSLLLNYDARLERQNASASLNSLQAHYTNVSGNKPKPKFPSPPGPHSMFQSNRPRGQRPPFSPPLLPTPSSRPPVSASQPQKPPRPRCQICLKPGHSANVCYHRTNLQYQPVSYPPRNFSTVLPSQPALPTASATTIDPAWYMDSGASHHFTPDLNLLDSATPYSGDDQITVGNGKLVSISHVGQALLPSSSSCLRLHSVYCSPFLQKNLLSVSRLCSDNKAFIEFYPHFFLVKDQVSRQVLLRGILENGIYRVCSSSSSCSSSPQLHSISLTPSKLWHCRLGHLSEGYCLSLFKKWAFREGDENRYPQLVRIGSDIVRKCGGIPLAVKTLASLLFSKTDQQDWIHIRDKEIWQLPQKDNDILPALKLSYDQMCLLLKQCFSLLSIFPKDYLISRDFLIQLWTAHGLLRPSNDREDLEDVGSRYVNELYSRSFIQDFYDFGRISCFQVHDLVHDLACSVAENQCFVMDTEIKNIPEKVRHLSFSSYSDSLGRHVINASLNPERVRTVFFLTDNCTFTPPTKWFIDQCISKFKHLRLLDLAALSITELPSSIGSLKHLRHMDLSLNKIKRLPYNINKLKHLQMLGLYDCSELEQLPELCNMISLRILGLTSKQMQLPQIGVGCLSSLVDLRFFRCHNIECLFEGMQNLFALRTLDIKYCRNLLTLPRALKFLPALKTLLIIRCEKINLEMDEEEDRQLGWSQLRTLTMKYLPSLTTFSHWFQGSSFSLQNLSIIGCPEISELPEWLSDLKSIEKIEIFNSPKLKSLPQGMDGVTSLRKLLLGECPILSERCKRESGDDWRNIAHISEVYIDGEKISTNAI